MSVFLASICTWDFSEDPLEVSRHAQSQSLLCEHAPRSDAAKPDPPSATGVVTYQNRLPPRFEIRVSFLNGYIRHTIELPPFWVGIHAHDNCCDHC